MKLSQKVTLFFACFFVLLLAGCGGGEHKNVGEKIQNNYAASFISSPFLSLLSSILNP